MTTAPLNPAADAATNTGAPQKAREFLVASPRLLRAQRLHAWLITVVPTLGVGAAVFLAVRYGVTAFDLGLLAVTYLVTMVGTTTGYHRLLAHRAFQTHGPIRALLAFMGAMAAQGSPVYWVSNHRRHHRHSDRAGDPHSPHVVDGEVVSTWRGLWHAQFAWPHTHLLTNTMLFAPDLLRDPWVARVSHHYYPCVLAGLAVPALAGGLWYGTLFGLLSGLVWGGLVRLFISYHAINSVNSITHMFGSRPYETAEHSTNNVLVAVPTLGEGWHNNHHAFPASAKFGHRYWQLDVGYWPIAVLAAFGLAWDVIRPRRGSAFEKHALR